MWCRQKIRLGRKIFSQLRLINYINPNIFQPEHIYIVRGQLLDGVTMKPLNGDVAYHDLMTTTEHGTSSTENGTGEYTLFLEKNYVYGIDAAVNKYISLSYFVDTKEIDSTHIKTLDLYLFPVQVGTTIPLDNLFFKSSSADILPESATELNRIAGILMEYPGMKLQITGYTDNTGTAAFNQTLSKQRAEAVKKYLIGKGLSNVHFETVGMGTAHPVATNASASGRQKNRRVEITILHVQ
jgi:outer membrane protein OmpA-like peptidoglycan-associated protein